VKSILEAELLNDPRQGALHAAAVQRVGAQAAPARPAARLGNSSRGWRRIEKNFTQ